MRLAAGLSCQSAARLLSPTASKLKQACSTHSSSLIVGAEGSRRHSTKTSNGSSDDDKSWRTSTWWRVEKPSEDLVLPAQEKAKSAGSYFDNRPAIEELRKKKWVTARKLDAETRFPVYSHLRPTGAIDSMKMTEAEVKVEQERVYARANPTKALLSTLTHRPPRLHLLKTEEEINKHLKVIQQGQVISIDRKWESERQDYGGRTSILSIASATDIFLLQMYHLRELPREVLRIIGDATIVKCGEHAFEDAKELQVEFAQGAKISTLVQLRFLEEIVNVKRGPVIKRIGSRRRFLDRCCRDTLRRRLNQDYPADTWEWNADVLTFRQVDCAASDVYAMLEIFHQLVRRVANPDNSDPFQQPQVQRLIKRAAKLSSQQYLSASTDRDDDEYGTQEKVGSSLGGSANASGFFSSMNRIFNRGVETIQPNDTAAPVQGENDQSLIVHRRNRDTEGVKIVGMNAEQMRRIRIAWQNGDEESDKALRQQYRQEGRAYSYRIILKSFILDGINLKEEESSRLIKDFKGGNISPYSHFHRYFRSQGLRLVKAQSGDWHLVVA